LIYTNARCGNSDRMGKNSGVLMFGTPKYLLERLLSYWPYAAFAGRVHGGLLPVLGQGSVDQCNTETTGGCLIVERSEAGEMEAIPLPTLMPPRKTGTILLLVSKKLALECRREGRPCDGSSALSEVTQDGAHGRHTMHLTESCRPGNMILLQGCSKVWLYSSIPTTPVERVSESTGNEAGSRQALTRSRHYVP
jgi:hypothetical protein